MRAVRSINSVAAKMRASLMVEAELLVEGQVVLDRDGCDVYLALWPASSRHLLRRRKPRPKPVPEGQLALFGRPGGHEETGSLGAEGLLSPV